MHIYKECSMYSKNKWMTIIKKIMKNNDYDKKCNNHNKK